MAWLPLQKTWHDTDVDYCEVCGNLLIERAWTFDGRDGKLVRACREDDERLYGLLHAYAPRIEEQRRGWEARTQAPEEVVR